MTEKPFQTPAFGIEVFILFIVFLVILNDLPFPSSYGFLPLTGITAVTSLVGFGVYSLAVGIVESIYKITVEVTGAILLFINVVYGDTCRAIFEQIKLLILE